MERSAKLLRQAGSWYQGQRLLACAFAMRGESALAMEAGNELLQAAKRPEEQSLAHVVIAALHSHEGKLEEAGRVLLQGLEFDARKGLEALSATKSLGLAYLAWLQGESEKVQVHASLAMLRGDGLTMVPHAVALLYRAGHLAAASKARRDWEGRVPRDVPRFVVSSEWMRGEAALAAGDPNGVTSLKRMAALASRILVPEPLFYGLRKCGEQGLAKEMAGALMKRPAVLWYSPETTAVGINYYCRQLAEK